MIKSTKDRLDKIVIKSRYPQLPRMFVDILLERLRKAKIEIDFSQNAKDIDRYLASVIRHNETEYDKIIGYVGKDKARVIVQGKVYSKMKLYKRRKENV